ncbi:hypothetical protein LP419_29680 [Massilia sp. H-1]|nr:hypothetical protein LP419_29680 [Massilia sp. H-1]
MRSLAIMRESNCPVVFDATHSGTTAGRTGHLIRWPARTHPRAFARSRGSRYQLHLFMETHPNPAQALSDGPNAVPLGRMKELLTTLVDIDRIVKKPVSWNRASRDKGGLRAYPTPIALTDEGGSSRIRPPFCLPYGE